MILKDHKTENLLWIVGNYVDLKAIYFIFVLVDDKALSHLGKI